MTALKNNVKFLKLLLVVLSEFLDKFYLLVCTRFLYKEPSLNAGHARKTVPLAQRPEKIIRKCAVRVCAYTGTASTLYNICRCT